VDVEGFAVLYEGVPNFYGVFPGHPDFEAEVAGVAGAGDVHGNAGYFGVGDAKVLQIRDAGVSYGFKEAAGGGALHGQRGHVFGGVDDFYVETEGVLLEPAETRVGGSPAIVIFAETGDGAVVDDVALGIAPTAVDDLVDCDFVDVAGDDAVDEFGGVFSGDAIFEERGDVDERGGVADGVVLVLVVHFVDAYGVVAGPFAVVEALAKGEGAFVECGSYWHWGSVALVVVRMILNFVAYALLVLESHSQDWLCHQNRFARQVIIGVKSRPSQGTEMLLLSWFLAAMDPS